MPRVSPVNRPQTPEGRWGGPAVKTLFLNVAWICLFTPRAGWGIGGPQIKPALKMALSDAVVGSDKTVGRTKAGDSLAPPHFLTDRLELEEALRGAGFIRGTTLYSTP